MNKTLLALAVLTLTGCNPAHVEPIVQQVYCLSPDQFAALLKAEPAKIGGTLTGDARVDVKIEGGQNVLLRQYSDGLLRVLGNCVGSAAQNSVAK